jgi:hypothetical protein
MRMAEKKWLCGFWLKRTYGVKRMIPGASEVDPSDNGLSPWNCNHNSQQLREVRNFPPSAACTLHRRAEEYCPRIGRERTLVA